MPIIRVFMNVECLPLSRIRRCGVAAAWLLGCAVMGSEAVGATLWQLPVRFTEFRGRPGGFEANGTTRVVLEDGSGDGETTRAYDIFRPGASPGVVVSGQDGVTDLSMRSMVRDGSDGRWATAQLERDRAQMRAHVVTTASTSRSGDSAVMAFELTFDSRLGVTADHLAVNLSGISGRGDLYEWAFVTVGGIEEAPFDPAAVDTYTARDYSVVPDGVVPGSGPTVPLAHGRPMSAFLAGQTRTTAAAGLVQPGWWAADGFNVAVSAGRETTRNPAPAADALNRSYTVTGAALGLAATELVEKVTVWFGFNDVAFDTNGDGFTRTSGDHTARLVSLTLGASAPAMIPEPDLATLVSLGLAFFIFRSRFRNPHRAASR